MSSFIIFLFFVSHGLCLEKKLTIDELLGKKYEFGLFENFDGSGKAYQQEKLLLHKLKSMRDKLINVKTQMEKKKDLQTLLKNFQQLKETQTELGNNLNNLTSEFPIKEDHEGAVKAMFTLFYAYRFNLTEAILHGKLSFTDSYSNAHSLMSHEKLSVSSVESILDVAINREIYASGVQIMNQLLLAVEHLKLDTMLKRLQPKKNTLIKLNNGYLMKTRRILHGNIEVLPYLINKDLKAKKKQPDFVLKGEPFNNDKPGKHNRNEEWVAMAVCQSGKFLSPAPDALTHLPNCRYLHHMDPYLKLGPFKEEEVSEKPYAVVFHDILSDIEINYLVETARPNLSRKRTFHDTSGATALGHRSDVVRVIHKTVQAWLSEVEWPKDKKMVEDYVGKNYLKMNHPVLWKLAAKIKLATQLETQSHFSATDMQVTNYGLGGLCESHIDPHGLQEMEDKGQTLGPNRKGLTATGDLMGTFMAWLGDTEAGGGTVFIYPGYETIIMPEKGSAAFWYDLDSSLYKDNHSWHAGCPILKGSKWILNKWIHAYDNFSKFPCKLQKRARFDAPSNSHYYS